MDIKDFFAQKSFSFSKRVEFLPRTRTRYVENASQSYGVELDPQKLLFILDDTVMGSGRDGCVIAVTGIAFKAMFQQPWFIPFEKIKKVQVIGKAVVINVSAHAQEFTIVDGADVRAVFAAVQEWIDYRDRQTVDYIEYTQKMKKIKIQFKEVIMPFVKMLLHDYREDKEGVSALTDEVSDCIDDIERLESLLNSRSLRINDVNYIDDIFSITSAFDGLVNSDESKFDENLLKPKHYDQAMGKFIKIVLTNLVIAVKQADAKKKKMDRLNDYL